MTEAAPTTSGAQTVLAALFEARSGQRIAPGRAWRLDMALRPILREIGLETLDALVLRLLDGRHPALADQVVDALLNQETSFFRDPGVFEATVSALAATGEPRPRIWCAGCATGQEPLSLAMLFAERGGPMPEIVATDLSDRALARARLGRFTQFEIQRGLPVGRMIRWFEGQGEEWTARPELLRAVSFRRQNIVADVPPPGEFDAIFCRNLLFYLPSDARRGVLARLAGTVRPGGFLVLGAGETVIGQSEAFEPSRRFRGLYEPVPRPWPPRVAAGA